MKALPACFALLLSCASQASAQEWELTGYSALEHRQFFQGGLLPGQHGGTANPSIVLEPEIYKTSGPDTLTARMFFRLDSHDSERTHVDIRQLDWVRAQDDWEIRAGISKVFWGVTESQHLVDVINQTDAVEDVDGEDKLGQPMVQLATFQKWGDLRFYYLPYARERTFPGREGRLRGPLLIDTDHARYTHDAKEWYPSVALRYKRYIGAWDIGLAHFHGTSREPTLRQITPGTLTPVYEIIDQSSMDVQYTSGSWLWKIEAIGRAGHGDYFGAAAGGFEYTLYNLQSSGTDVGLLLEYHRDGRKFNAPTTVFNNDVFTGTRIALNNTDDTEFLGGVVVDAKDGSQSYFVEASTRLTNHLKLEVDARIFSSVDSNQPAYFARDDDYVQLRLNYFF